MTERPILFSTPMVQALLDGRKTMTRRIEKEIEPESKFLPEFKFSGFTFIEPDQFEKPDNEKIASVISCRYGQPGDVLWVREKFACTLGKYEPETTYSYFADSFHWSFFPEDKSNGETSCQWHDPDLAKEVKWKPSIHMPKAAARIWLQVEEIRVERLQDISEEDMISEGLLIPTFPNGHPAYALGNKNSAVSFLPEECFSAPGPPPTKKQILFAFWAELWCKINGRESWDANPWVWVVKFKTLSTTGKPQMCYKTNEVCKYDCKGLCRESM